MKLIDILVEELPKRGGWPEGADYCIQHAHDLGFRWVIFNKGVVNSTSADAEGKWEMDWEFSHKHDFCADELASDHTTAIITREQYEAALAAKNEGWIEWAGGKPPVDNAAVVDIKLRAGEIASGVEAGKYYWPHTGYESDIIAYRLHQPTKSEQVRAAAWNAYAGITRADDEADLNECIGQDAAPVWNGEGVTPPVGCVCERSWAGDEWQSCKIIFASGQIVVVKLKESGREDAYNIGEVAFRPTRPIRSEADRKRDEAVKTIMLTGWCQTAAEEIYDLVAAGKVPGMKLED